MIGMNFQSFLTLLILGIIAAIVMQSSLRYPASQRVDSFFANWIAGWIGGWLGSAVLGHWWFRIQNIYMIPALIGAFVGVFSLMYWRNTTAIVATTPKGMSTLSSQPEMQRKAS